VKSSPLAVGFVGTGRMGSPMALHVRNAGHRLYVHDVLPAAAERLVRAGAIPVAAPAELATLVDVVVTSLPGPAEVDAVMRGAQGILAGKPRNLLVVETSTIGPAQCRSLAQTFAASACDFVDAPVSGGVGSAEAGRLTAMAGGERTAFDRALPVLRCFAADVRYLGPSGSGSIAKLINQMVYLSYVASFCEAVAFGRRAALDVPALLDVLRTSVAGQPLLTGWEHQIETGDLTPGFRISRVLKDLELGVDACREQEGAAPLLDGVVRAFRELAEHGYGDADMTALYAVQAGERERARGSNPDE
jgi:3-hydroxyisobutyrate dehydrogenase-like beta-hydroxyacid dehydrogenase